ncbi:hypothetical protein D3C72_1921230 [compost metagenome]
MLQEPVDDASDRNMLAQAWNARAQTAYPSYDQVDCNAGSVGFIQIVDDLLVRQGVHLGDDSGRTPCGGMLALPLDQSP